MAKKSKLLSALDAHKNVDYGLQKQKKLQKQAAKRKRSKEPSGFFYKGEPIMSGGLQEAEKCDEVSEDGSNDHPSQQKDGSRPLTAAVRTQSTTKRRLRLTLNSRSIPLELMIANPSARAARMKRRFKNRLPMALNLTCLHPWRGKI